MAIADQLLKGAQVLSKSVNTLSFKEPITHVYNPLDYAWEVHEQYIKKYANSTKKVLFMGMNPGPFGMAQTGIPFGEVELVRDWLELGGAVKEPRNMNPKRMIQGFDCPKSEVSGRRLWSFLKAYFGSAELFFKDHFVLNYCPLVFMELSGRNRTPDKLPLQERKPLYDLCDAHLKKVVAALEVEWVIGIGAFAESRAKESFSDINNLKIGRILHPSPASPQANRGWDQIALKQLKELDILS
jgi:single-strand selective monofunctional uracil DNA glycosylase